MATIPMGNFGQAVARPGPVVNVPAANPIGEATTRTLQIAGDVNVDMMAQETRRQQQALQEAQAEQKRKDQEAAAAALRAKTITALTGTKDRLADLHDEIGQGVLSGTIPKDQAEAEYTKRAGKVLEGVGADLPEGPRAIVLAELNADAARLGNGVRKAVTQRDRQDVTAGITSTLESLQRQYRDNPAQATTQAMALVDQLGPHSTLTPDQQARLKQTWKEGTQYATGYELISAGRNDRKALDAAEQAITSGLPDLDPQKRATLLDRVSAYRLHLDQKAEMAAARAQREWERRMTQAEKAFNVMQTLADKGTVLEPSYVDEVLRNTAGTPFQAGIKALAQQAKESGGLAAQPIPVQRQTLDQIDALIAQQGRTPELDKRREQVAKVLQGSEADMQRDPLRAGLERGVITQIKPLSMQGGIASVAQQIGERVQQAQTVQQWAGRSVSPVTTEEAQSLGQMLRTLNPAERGNAVAMLTQVIPPQQAQALAKQIDAQDRPLALALGVGANRTGWGRTTAELILRGAQVVKDKGVKEEQGAEFGLRAQIAKTVGDAVPAAARQDVIDAARLIYLAKQSEGQGTSAESAVRLAIGGDIVEHNGRRVPVPAGVDLDAKLRAYSPASMAKQAPDGVVYLAGRRPMGVPEFLAGLPAATLEPAGYGRYMVRSGPGLVLRQDGQPVVIEVAP